MDEEFNDDDDDSVASDSSSPILPYIPRRYDRSLIVPSILSERKSHLHGTVIQLPPLKLSPAVETSEQDDFLALSLPTTERELSSFKQKFNRLRVTLSKSHEFHLYTCEKVRQKRSDLRRTVHEQRKLIDQLLATSVKLNHEIKHLRDEITKQCHKRDAYELKQLKLRSTFNHLDKTQDEFIEILQTTDKARVLEQYNNRLLQLNNQYQDELVDRDNQIEKLKEKVSEKFGSQAVEHKKIIRATEQAFTTESKKCKTLQEFVDDYEANVYRAKKPCCISTSYRLCRLSTELRLYSIIELTLHELFHSSCSCGPFERCHKTFMRLHNK